MSFSMTLHLNHQQENLTPQEKTMIPNHIPSQIEYVRRAKAGDAEAIDAIRALPDAAWMRLALDDPSWGKSERVRNSGFHFG